MTLRRQFPSVRGRGAGAIVELYRRLGPVQTQVPRAAFLFAASRLPGVGYADLVSVFEAYTVVKASNIRGTVHTSDREQHAWLGAATERPRSMAMRNLLSLDRCTPGGLTAEIERFTTGQWRERKEVVEHVRGWLAEDEARAGADPLSTTASKGLVWGHARLVRRPRDSRWETRTDTLHRYAPDLYPVPRVGVLEATQHLVRQHLASYGPARRRDIAWWLGARLADVDAALDRLGDEVVRLRGPDGGDLLDLAEPPQGGAGAPGVRLLPEFDGLLLGYEDAARDRFVARDHLPRLFGSGNGLMHPLVLHEGRVVAQWRLLTRGRRRDIEVQMLPGCRAPGEDEFTSAVAAVQSALEVEVGDLRIR